jgi:hypothetical protein
MFKYARARYFFFIRLSFYHYSNYKLDGKKTQSKVKKLKLSSKENLGWQKNSYKLVLKKNTTR